LIPTRQDETHQWALDLGYIPVVPPLRTRVEPWEYDREMYKRRHEVECLFRRFKGSGRIFSRFGDSTSCSSASSASYSSLTGSGCVNRPSRSGGKSGGAICTPLIEQVKPQQLRGNVGRKTSPVAAPIYQQIVEDVGDQRRVLPAECEAIGNAGEFMR
jgi:hypothetical protein